MKIPNPAVTKRSTPSIIAFQNEENVPPPHAASERGNDIAAQIGYSPWKGSNVFMDLSHQLQKDSPCTAPNLTTCSPSYNSSPQFESWEPHFWTLVALLPSKRITDELVQVFLSELDWYSGIFERYYVLQLSQEWWELCSESRSKNEGKKPLLRGLKRDVLYLPAVLLQICAVALHFMPPETAAIRQLGVEDMRRRDLLSERLSDRGLQVMDVLGRHRPTMTSVQHDIMRALWLKDVGRGTESWHSLCNSVRQAQELNMHRQSRVDQSGTVAETLDALWYDEARRRLWVILFIWDSHMSLMLGRPRLINLDDCDIQVPIDCPFPSEPSTVVPIIIRTAGDNETPYPISGHLFRYSLSSLIHELKTSGANKRHPKDYKSIQALHEQAESFMEALPAFLRYQNPDTSWDTRLPWIPRQREQILVAGQSFLLALHRPHIHTSPKSRKAAIQAALAILDSQQRVFEFTKQYQYKLFGLAFFTIEAGFFLSSTTIMYPSTDREFSRRVDISLQHGIARLEKLEHHNAIAGSSLHLLRHCYKLLQEAVASRANYFPPVSVPEVTPESVAQFVESQNQNQMIQDAPVSTNGFENFHPMEYHTHVFPDQVQFPSSASLIGFPNIQEFDPSWIDGLDQIPFVSMDTPNVDNSWDF